jgi:ribosomal protein S18 acetylase RimI-like enzyme
MEIRAYRTQDKDAVIALWERCGLIRPWNDPHQDIERKLQVQPDMFLVGVTEGKVVATVMAGYEGHRGWLNYLAVDPEERMQGFGRAIVVEAEKRLRAMGCPKINLQIRKANAGVIAFYAALGYKEDDVVSMGKHLAANTDSK